MAKEQIEKETPTGKKEKEPSSPKKRERSSKRGSKEDPKEASKDTVEDKNGDHEPEETSKLTPRSSRSKCNIRDDSDEESNDVNDKAKGESKYKSDSEDDESDDNNKSRKRKQKSDDEDYVDESKAKKGRSKRKAVENAKDRKTKRKRAKSDSEDEDDDSSVEKKSKGRGKRKSTKGKAKVNNSRQSRGRPKKQSPEEEDDDTSKADEDELKKDILEKLKNKSLLEDSDYEALHKHFIHCSGPLSGNDDGRKESGAKKRGQKGAKEKQDKVQTSTLIRFMKAEFKNKEWDMKKIKSAMEDTYKERRFSIMNDDPPTVNAVREMYPFLFLTEQAILEFERITGIQDIEDTFYSNIKKYSTRILELIPPSSKLSKMITKMKDETSDSEETGIEYVGALYGLPQIVDEDLSSFVQFKDAVQKTRNRHPMIWCDTEMEESLKGGKFKVLVEQVQLCETKNAMQAFLVYLASFYIFNVCYDSSCMGTIAILQALFAEYEDDELEWTKKAEEIQNLLKSMKK